MNLYSPAVYGEVELDEKIVDELEADVVVVFSEDKETVKTKKSVYGFNSLTFKTHSM